MMAALQNRLKEALARGGAAFNIWIIALILIQATLGFLSVGLFLWFRTTMVSWQAALATGAVTLALAVLTILLAVKVARGKQASPRTEKMAAETEAAARVASGRTAATPPPEATADEAAALLAEAQRFTRNHPFAATLGAGLVGVVLGLNSKLRDDILRLLR